MTINMTSIRILDELDEFGKVRFEDLVFNNVDLFGKVLFTM